MTSPKRGESVSGEVEIGYALSSEKFDAPTLVLPRLG